MKTCSKCSVLLPESAFYKEGRYLSVHCRECKKADARELYAAKREIVTAQKREKYARDPQVRDRQIANAVKRQKLKPRILNSAYRAAYYQAHREHILEGNRKYKRSKEANAARNAKRRAFLGSVAAASAKQIKARFEMFGNHCVYCGALATSADHVIPLARGGSALPANIRPACKSCNSSKGAKKLSEWKRAA